MTATQLSITLVFTKSWDSATKAIMEKIRLVEKADLTCAHTLGQEPSTNNNKHYAQITASFIAIIKAGV